MTVSHPHPLKRIPVCLLAVIAAIFSGCHWELTQAETEQQVLAATFRYYYDHDLLPQAPGPTPKVVFVGVPSVNWAGSGPVIETYFSDPTPEWQAALASTGISTRPSSAAEFDGMTGRFRDPTSKEIAEVFSVHSIVLSAPGAATVTFGSSSGPLFGGRHTYRLEKDHHTWRVVDAQITAVY